MIELGNSLYVAVEEANFLLHRIWIHTLGSEYHPQVKQFSFLPEKDEVEPDPEKWMPLPPQNWTANPNTMSGEEWETQRTAFHSQLSRQEQEAVSDLRSRIVHFTILARKLDNLEKPETYQLTFTVYLGARAPVMEWRADFLGEVKLANVQTGEQKVLPTKFSVLDCMNTHFYPSGSKESRFELAKRYFS